MNNRLGLYLHIPFCLNKCQYCDFYSVTDRSCLNRYVDALLLHMEDYAPAARENVVDTVYIGGGTPSALPPKEIVRLLNGVYQNFRVPEDAAVSMEVNPGTVNLRALRTYRDVGINRLSIGMQSACDNELAALGRIHTYADFTECYANARRAGFDNINADVMFGIPEQTPQTLKLTLDALCDLDPEHISLYGLKIEENTPFYEQKDTLALPDEDTEYEMYRGSCELLSARGYQHYEISNFAKQGKRCMHNLKYWFCSEYLGLGPGAHSYFGGRRFSFKRDLQLYMETMEEPDAAYDLTDENYEIAPSERLGEYVMLQLRLCRGLSESAFSERFGIDFMDMFGEQVEQYCKGGFMERRDGFVRFTDSGRYVSNYILSSMLDFSGGIAADIANGSDA